MTQEEEKYYDNYFDLFITDGWKQLVEDSKKELELFRIRDIPDEKTLYITQGKLHVLENITNLEDLIRNSYESLKDE